VDHGNYRCRIAVCSAQSAPRPAATVTLSLLVHVATVVLVLLFLSVRSEPAAPPAETSVALLFEPAPVSSPAAAVLPQPESPVVEPPPSVVETPPEATPAPAQEAQPAPDEPSPRVPAQLSKPAVTARAHNAPIRPRVSPAPTETQSASVAPVVRTATALLLVPPRPVAGMETNRAPIYPPGALRRGEQGRVMLRVNVSADGTPLDVALLETSGHSSLDSAALSAVRQWRFVPAMQGGTPVSAVAEVPVRFRLDN
jgi:protein TonB